MRRSVLRSLGAAACVIAIAQNAWAQLADQIGDQIVHGVPLAGVDVGASFPISHFQHSASTGGAIAPYVGYQIGVPIIDGFTFTPIFQPQFAGFGSCCGDDLWSITSVMAGAEKPEYEMKIPRTSPPRLNTLTRWGAMCSRPIGLSHHFISTT